MLDLNWFRSTMASNRSLTESLRRKVRKCYICNWIPCCLGLLTKHLKEKLDKNLEFSKKNTNKKKNENKKNTFSKKYFWSLLTNQTFLHSRVNQIMPFISMSLFLQKLNKRFIVPHVIRRQFRRSFSIGVSSLYCVITQMYRFVATWQCKRSWTESQIGVSVHPHY